jgi:uncharacterized protein
VTAEDGSSIVQRLIERVGTLDIDAALELTTEDLVLDLPFRADGGPRHLEGKAARSFVAAMPKLFSRLPFPEIVVHGALPSGEIVAEYRSEGETRSGREYSNVYVGFFMLREGRIASWREYFDPNVVSAAFPAS